MKRREVKDNAKTDGLSSWRANADINLDNKGCQRQVSGRWELSFAHVKKKALSRIYKQRLFSNNFKKMNIVPKRR